MATDLLERYEDDLALVKGIAGWTAVLTLLGALAAAPLLLPRLGLGYLLFIAVLAAAHVVVAVGLNLLVGVAGLISLGHAGFVAIGAYTSGLLMARIGVPWYLAWAGAAVASALFGFLVGLPALRLAGPYLTIATLGFGIAVYQVLTNWTALSGGRMGLPVPALPVYVSGLSAMQHLYYLAVGTAVLLVWMAYNLARSHVGRAFVALRDSDIAAEVLGINLTRYKTLAFGLSAAYAGVAGAILAQALRHLEPQAFTFLESITYLAMIVVGGLGTVSGAVIGGVLLTLLPHYLSDLKQWLPVVYGGVIMLMMGLEPLGLYGRWVRIRLYLRLWPL